MYDLMQSQRDAVRRTTGAEPTPHRVLERLSGAEITEAPLAEAIKLTNQQRHCAQTVGSPLAGGLSWAWTHCRPSARRISTS